MCYLSLTPSQVHSHCCCPLSLFGNLHYTFFSLTPIFCASPILCSLVKICCCGGFFFPYNSQLSWYRPKLHESFSFCCLTWNMWKWICSFETSLCWLKPLTLCYDVLISLERMAVFYYCVDNMNNFMLSTWKWSMVVHS